MPDVRLLRQGTSLSSSIAIIIADLYFYKVLGGLFKVYKKMLSHKNVYCIELIGFHELIFYLELSMQFYFYEFQDFICFK